MTEQQTAAKWHWTNDGQVCCCEDGGHDGWRQPNVISYLNSLERSLTAARTAKEEAERERREIIAGFPWHGDLDGKSLVEAVRAEMDDFQMIIRNTSEIIDGVTHSRASKPNTAASVVVSLAEEVANELVQEETADLQADLATAEARATAAKERETEVRLAMGELLQEFREATRYIATRGFAFIYDNQVAERAASLLSESQGEGTTG